MKSNKNMGTLCFASENSIENPNISVAMVQGEESRGFNDKVHRISCRYLDKTCKKINYISLNT